MVRAAGVGFLLWVLIRNLHNPAHRWSRFRLEGLFSALIGVQLLALGMMLDRHTTEPRDYIVWLIFTAALSACWVYGQLLLALIVFAVQLPFALIADNEFRRTTRH